MLHPRQGKHRRKRLGGVEVLAGHHDDVDSGSWSWLWRLGLVVVGSKEEVNEPAQPRDDVRLDSAERRQEDSIGD